MESFKYLVQSQLKRIGRDSMMVVLLVYPIITMLLGRFLVPVITKNLAETGVDLTLHYHTIMVFLVVITPILYGNIVGLMLLEEKEENTLDAIRVLPIPLHHYMLAKTSLFFVLSIVTGIIVTMSVGLYPVTLIEAIVINGLAALGVPFGALFILLFANNKVEGFATMKASGFMLLLPMGGLYLSGGLRWLIGVFPAFWPTMAMASVYEKSQIAESIGLFALGGTVYTLLLIIVMYKYVVTHRLNR